MAYRRRSGLMLNPKFGTINHLDPLNNRLIGLWPGTEPGKFANMKDNSNPIDLSNYLSTTSIGVSPWGRAAKWTAANGQFGNSHQNIQVYGGGQNTGFSASCWVWPSTFSNYQSPFNQWNEAGNLRLWGLIIFGDATLHAYTSGDGLVFNNLASSGTLTANKWQMITMTYGSGDTTVRVYVNSILTGTATGQNLRQNSQPLYLGKSPFFAGAADQLFNGQSALHRLWGRQLKTEEVMRLYAMPLAGIVAPRRILRAGSGTVTRTGNMFFSR